MQYDAAIIGAGPAGCAAAITLARAGRSVIVLEKRTFPRHKVCGGCLSGWAVQQLRELLGGEFSIPGSPGSKIDFSIGGRVIHCPSDGRTQIVMRADLDFVLAEAARSTGAELRFGGLARLVRCGGNFDVIVPGETVKADTIVLASGLGGLALKTGIQSRPFGSAMIGRQWTVSAQAVGVSSGAVEMHWLRGGYLGLAAPNETDCIVAMAMKSAGLCGEDPLCALRRLNPGADIWDRVSDLQECHVRGAAGFPFVPNQLCRANVMLIGDAAGYCEPFSGTGIGMAIHSGTSAAQAIIAGGEAARHYALAIRRHRTAMWRTRILSAALNSRIAQGLLYRSFLRIENLVSNLVDRVHVRSAI